MTRWMATFEMTAPREEVLPLVPAERARVAELMAEGALEALYLAAEGGRGWLVMVGGSRTEVDSALASLPMYHLMRLDVAALREG